MPCPGELVLIVSPKGKRYLRRAGTDPDLHTQDGRVPMEEIVAAPFGASVRSHLGTVYRLEKPTIYDLVKGLKRQTQIIYPKEIGYIIMKLGIGPGIRVIEAGSGSGSLTTALSWFTGPTGRVYTYDRRPEFSQLCAKNLAWAGQGQNVELHVRDISEGFLQENVDALFLDTRTPWDYLDQAVKAVAPGAPFGFLLPTVNQVSDLIAALEQGPFGDIEVMELLLRRYKVVPDRLRPEDRMVAHTGFLIFARHQEKPVPLPQPPAEAEGPDEAIGANGVRGELEDLAERTGASLGAIVTDVLEVTDMADEDEETDGM